MYRSAGERPDTGAAANGAPPPDRGADPSTLATEHLEAELCSLASRIEAGMVRFLALIDEYDRREGWGQWWGVLSTAHWISWQCSCSVRTAREYVRVATALRELPLIGEAFARGSLSYSKVRALTRVATPGSQDFLLHQARYATASQLDRMLSAYERSEGEDPQPKPELRWSWNRDGTLHLNATLSPDDGRAFLDALETARSQIGEEAHECGEKGGSAEPQAEDDPAEPPEPLLGDVRSNTEALSLLAESFCAHGARERAGPRARLLVHVDAETLTDDRFGSARLEGGPAVSSELARRLGCDGELRALVERGRRALYLGRRTRAISPALNLALRERDLGCRFPGCDNHRFIDAHHIVHWSRGGTTDPENLILLCRRHHRLVHEGGFSVAGNANERVVFRNPRGEILKNAPESPPGSHRDLPWPERGLWIGDGERMDLALNVDAVAQAIHSP